MGKGDDEDEVAREVNCGQCWSHPGEPCRKMSSRPGVPTSRNKRTVHPARVSRARRRGLLPDKKKGKK